MNSSNIHLRVRHLLEDAGEDFRIRNLAIMVELPIAIMVSWFDSETLAVIADQNSSAGDRWVLTHMLSSLTAQPGSVKFLDGESLLAWCATEGKHTLFTDEMGDDIIRPGLRKSVWGKYRPNYRKIWGLLEKHGFRDATPWRTACETEYYLTRREKRK